MTDAALARWEAEYTMLQAWALGSPPLEQVEMVLALIAEVRRLREMVREVEWAGIIWTDTRTCLFCSNLHPENPPPRAGRDDDRGHRPDCQWVAAVGAPQIPAPQVTETSITTQTPVGTFTATGVIITST